MKLERSTARIVSIALLFALPACGAPEEAAPSDAEAAIVADSAALMPVDAKIEAGRFAIENGVFNPIFAKELCSCQFVDGLTLDDGKAGRHHGRPDGEDSFVGLQGW